MDRFSTSLPFSIRQGSVEFTGTYIYEHENTVVTVPFGLRFLLQSEKKKNFLRLIHSHQIGPITKNGSAQVSLGL